MSLASLPAVAGASRPAEPSAGAAPDRAAAARVLQTLRELGEREEETP